VKHRPLLNLVSLIGHNRVGHPDWFKYGPGQTAPGVITRERGTIPGCYPADIEMYNTSAEPNDPAHYLAPNACRLNVKRPQLALVI
jgi:hypothetical protein